MTEAEKLTLVNHIAALVKRLLAAKGVEGAFANVSKALEIGQWLEMVETSD